jgi:hypothetical protein
MKMKMKMRNFGLLAMMFLICFACVTNVTKAQPPGYSTAEELAWEYFGYATWTSYDMGSAADGMTNAYYDTIALADAKIESAVEDGLTTAQLATIVGLREDAVDELAAFNLKWHGTGTSNPSGVVPPFPVNSPWVYTGPAMTNFQYMFAWYTLGGYYMEVAYGPFGIEEDFTKAMMAYSTAWGKFQEYIQDCNDAKYVLLDIQYQLNEIH